MCVSTQFQLNYSLLLLPLKQLIQYLKKYSSDNFNAKIYLLTGLFLALCIWLNYQFQIYSNISAQYREEWSYFPIMAVFMAFPYLVISSFSLLDTEKQRWPRSKEFWTKFVIAFIIIGIERSFYLHKDWGQSLDIIDWQFYVGTMAWGRTFLSTFLLSILFYWLYERKRDQDKTWFGLRMDQTNYKLYLSLIALVFGGIYLASYISELSAYYPRYQQVGGAAFANKHGFSEYVSVLIYELVYGASFINVELFFRGVLVIGFARILGPHAVLAMIGSYVFLHFGKPITECISSALGGYVIGILAFYSKRIWGGVVLHISLAWSMDLFAWLQNN